MAWITSKAGRIYLVACAGITAALLAHDLSKRTPAPPPAAQYPQNAFPRRSYLPSVVLPPIHPLADVAILPVLRASAANPVTLTNGATMTVSQIVRLGDGMPRFFTPSGTPSRGRYNWGPDYILPLSDKRTKRWRVVLATDTIPTPRAMRFGYIGESLSPYHAIPVAGQAWVDLDDDEIAAQSVRVVAAQTNIAATVAVVRLAQPANSVVPQHSRTVQDGYTFWRGGGSVKVTVPPPVMARIKDGAATLQFLVQTGGDGWQMVRSYEYPKNTTAAPEYERGDFILFAPQTFSDHAVSDVAVVAVPLQRVVFTGVPPAPKP